MNTQTDARVLKWLVYPRVCNIPERTHQFQQQWMIQWCDATCTSPGGQGFSHWHGIMCLPFGVPFYKSWYSNWGFSTQMKALISKNLVYYPIYINWVYFKQIIVKNTQFEQNWCFFCTKLVYWWVVKGTKIGTAKVERPTISVNSFTSLKLMGSNYFDTVGIEIMIIYPLPFIIRFYFSRQTDNKEIKYGWLI